MATDAAQGAGPSPPDNEDRDLQVLWQELSQLQAKQRKLRKQVEKHKPFEEYLLKVSEKIPKGCGDVEEPEEAMVDSMVEHYSKLFAASEDALRHLEVVTRMKETIRQSLESLVENHRALVPSLKIRLSQLQNKCHRKQWQWRQLEFSDACQKDSSLDTQPEPDSSNSQLLGCVQLAIDKMVQQCSSAANSVLGSMDLFSKLDVIKIAAIEKAGEMERFHLSHYGSVTSQ
uniref:uncharacterized protein CCDC197-like n=1 Tax=Jaculus jaculus TaxID=51337 RepID=UPI001E1B1711|nr:uncharacterized protein CCDC197-like [Jaculus jaculus]